jgi:hypothetical protein
LQVTAIPPNACAHPSADALNVWSVTNKQDYAHLHGHEFHLSSHNIDPTVKVRKASFDGCKMCWLLHEAVATLHWCCMFLMSYSYPHMDIHYHYHYGYPFSTASCY